VLLSGFVNPLIYLFDNQLAERGVLQVKHALPYSDMDTLSEEERAPLTERGDPLEFGHTLEDQIGGQVVAGFAITGFYEDRHRTLEIAKYSATYIATRAVKP
jgi:hypothetical protein